MKTTVLLKRTRLLVSLLLFLFINTSYAKNKVTITVVEKETGTRIPFAVVSIVGKANSKPVGMTDLSGVFTTTELSSNQKIVISSLGYTFVELSIPEKKSEITVGLKKGIDLKVVTITGSYESGTVCSLGCRMGYGCNSQGYSEIINTTPENLPETKNNVTLKIYPNPSNGNVRLSTGTENYLMELFDCTGKLVLNLNNVNDEHLIDLNEITAGIYFCRITKDGSTQTSRVVIN